MRLIVNILLFLLVLFLAYMVYGAIKEPIAFEEEKNRREQVVSSKLTEIRTAQEIYRSITGKFANNFDTLTYVLKNDSIPFEVIMGDPDDPTGTEFLRETTYSSALDSIMALGINLDSLQFVPYTNGQTFHIEADTMTYQQTLVPIVQVGVKWKKFMGKFADDRYSRYDTNYDPEKMMKFGDMTKPNLSGNWE